MRTTPYRSTLALILVLFQAHLAGLADGQSGSAPQTAAAATNSAQRATRADRSQSPPNQESALTPKQREMLSQALQQHAEEFKNLRQQMRLLQADLGRMSLTTNLNESLVRAKAEALAKLQVDDMVLRAKLFSSTVAPTLTQEQRDQIYINLYGNAIPGIPASTNTTPMPGSVAPSPPTQSQPSPSDPK